MKMGSVIEAEADLSTASPSTMGRETYTIKEEPLGSLRHIRIITIGAGVSGLNMIRSLKLHTTNISHVVYEKNADIGGTWYENRYPGCRCDIPSHNYQFSHTPNPGWSNLFAGAEEIEKYLRHVCEVHGLREFVKVNHSVVAARWEEREAEWVVEVRNEVTRDVFEDRCQFLLDASGILK
jgi:cation diffusion facilitator CzcD-associated flavoprotein CzcO